MRISDWSSDVCSSDLRNGICQPSQERALTPMSCSAIASRPTVTCSPEATTTSYSRASYSRETSPHHLTSRSEEHTSELQSLMRISYAVFCLKKKKNKITQSHNTTKSVRMNTEH